MSNQPIVFPWSKDADIILIALSKSQMLEEISELLGCPADAILRKAARLGITIVRHADTIERITVSSKRGRILRRRAAGSFLLS